MGLNGGSVAMNSGCRPWDLNQQLQEERTHGMIQCEEIEYFRIALVLCCVRGKDTSTGHHSKVEPGFCKHLRSPGIDHEASLTKCIRIWALLSFSSLLLEP
jgi:hypothetical protein